MKIQNTEHRTQNTEHRTQNTEHGTSKPPNLPTSKPPNLQTSEPIYADVIARWVEQNGGQPAIGTRNNTLFRLALDMRYITDFKEEWLFQELPHWGLTDDEVRSVIHSAVKEERLKGLPKRLVAAMDASSIEHQASSLEPQASSIEPQVSSIEDFLKDLTHRDLPPMPKLPRSLELLLEKAPAPFRPAILISMLPALGTLGTGLRFKYLDGQVHSPSFFAAVVAQSGAGKSFVRIPLELLMKPILDQDEVAREAENQYKLARQKMKNTKDQPNDPQVCIRCHPLNVTVANLIRHMRNSDNKHLFSFGEEIDTMHKAERSGWSAKKDIYRYAYDNGKFGSSNANENSLNVYQAVYYNILVCGTPGKVFRFFDDIEDGLVARVCFAQLPSEFAADMPVYEEYDEEDKQYIINVMQQLMLRKGMHANANVYNAARQWNAKAQSWARLTQSYAIDHYRRRACSMGFRAGMLIAVLEEIENSETSYAAKVTEWVANYCFTMLMRLFGDVYEKRAKADDERMQGLFSRPLLRKGKPQQMIAALPNEFTREDVIKLRLEAGQSTTKDSIRMIISRWLKENKIMETEDGKYSKT